MKLLMMTYGRLDDIVNTLVTPWNVGWVSLGIDRDGFSVDHELAILGFDGSLEAAMGGVILEHVCLQTCFSPRSIQHPQ